MQNINFRNILMVVGLVIVALIALGVASTILSAIIPLTITAVVAFILGRASVNVDLWKMLTSRREAAASAPAAAKTVQPAAAKPAKSEQKAAERLAEPEPEAQSKRESLLLKEDFEIKTSDQIEAEARQREKELTQRATAANNDVAAALEERRKRLLGSQGDQS